MSISAPTETNYNESLDDGEYYSDTDDKYKAYEVEPFDGTIVITSEHYKKLSTGKTVNICSYTIAECSWFIVSLNKDEYNEIFKKNEMNEDIDISSYTIECHDNLVEIRLGSWKINNIEGYFTDEEMLEIKQNLGHVDFDDCDEDEKPNYDDYDIEDFDFDTTVIDEKGWDCDQSTYIIECGIEIKEH